MHAREKQLVDFVAAPLILPCARCRPLCGGVRMGAVGFPFGRGVLCCGPAHQWGLAEGTLVLLLVRDRVESLPAVARACVVERWEDRRLLLVRCRPLVGCFGTWDPWLRE